MEELSEEQAPILLKTDNNSAATISNNAKFHKRIKHIRVRYHKIRELT